MPAAKPFLQLRCPTFRVPRRGMVTFAPKVTPAQRFKVEMSGSPVVDGRIPLFLVRLPLWWPFAPSRQFCKIASKGEAATGGNGTPPLQLKQKSRILSSRNEVRDLCGNSYSRIIALYRITVQRFFGRSLQNDNVAGGDGTPDLQKGVRGKNFPEYKSLWLRRAKIFQGL